MATHFDVISPIAAAMTESEGAHAYASPSVPVQMFTHTDAFISARFDLYLQVMARLAHCFYTSHMLLAQLYMPM